MMHGPAKIKHIRCYVVDATTEDSLQILKFQILYILTCIPLNIYVVEMVMLRVL